MPFFEFFKAFFFRRCVSPCIIQISNKVCQTMGIIKTNQCISKDISNIVQQAETFTSILGILVLHLLHRAIATVQFLSNLLLWNHLVSLETTLHTTHQDTNHKRKEILQIFHNDFHSKEISQCNILTEALGNSNTAVGLKEIFLGINNHKLSNILLMCQTNRV